MLTNHHSIKWPTCDARGLVCKMSDISHFWNVASSGWMLALWAKIGGCPNSATHYREKQNTQEEEGTFVSPNPDHGSYEQVPINLVGTVKCIQMNKLPDIAIRSGDAQNLTISGSTSVEVPLRVSLPANSKSLATHPICAWGHKLHFSQAPNNTEEHRKTTSKQYHECLL